jgi:hypothetical protein
VSQTARRWNWVTLVAVLILSACAGAPSDEHVIDEPVTVEPIKGQDVSRITLRASAAKRLDIQTAAVEITGNVMTVPSAAVLVDPTGTFWVYTNPTPLVFVRHRVGIDHEEGDKTFLTEGPPAGTKIVTVGVAELYGSETGV